MNKFWIFLFLSLFACEQKGLEKILIPEGLEVLQANENVKKLCLTCFKKLVVYLNIKKNSIYLFEINPGFWVDLLENHPELSVIIVITGQDPVKKRDRAYVIQGLEKTNFPFEVLYDPENKFYELNNLKSSKYPESGLQAFFVKDQDFFGTAEIGIPKLFEESFEKFIAD
jgi:hypothetical protein